MNRSLLLNILLIMPAGAIFTAPAPTIVSTESVFGLIGRNIKGIWHGITPSWVPITGALITAGTLSAGVYKADILSFSSTNHELKTQLMNTACKGAGLGLVIAGCTAGIYSYLDTDTANGIINRANQLINELKNKKICAQAILNANDAAFILGDSNALSSKYPLVSAANQLEIILPDILLLEKKCDIALKYANPADIKLCNMLTQCIITLSGHKNIVNNNLHFIKAINWQMYHAQLQLLQKDDSVAAQQLSAQAQHSATKLALLYAFGKLVGAIAKIPIIIIDRITN